MRHLLSVVSMSLAACLLAALAGCASPAAPGEDDPDSFEAVKDIHGAPYSDMMLVYLKTGPKSGSYSKEESAEIFKGHMANMTRLAEAGVLLVAGPFSAPRDKSWRGIFVLDTSSVQLAKLQAETDPGVKSGVFVADYQPIKASILMRQSGELEKAMLEKNQQIKEQGSPPPNLRGYVMLTADDADRAAAGLAKAGYGDKVVWCARFSSGTKVNRHKGGVFVLDAAKADEVTASFEKAGVPMTGMGLDGWYATASLVGFAPAVKKLQ